MVRWGPPLSVFPGLRSPLPDAGINTAVDRKVLAVALEGDAFYTKNLRFVPSLLCGRAQWTRVAHDDAGFARGVHRDLGRSRKDLRSRKASSRPWARPSGRPWARPWARPSARPWACSRARPSARAWACSRARPSARPLCVGRTACARRARLRFSTVRAREFAASSQRLRARRTHDFPASLNGSLSRRRRGECVSIEGQ